MRKKIGQSVVFRRRAELRLEAFGEVGGVGASHAVHDFGHRQFPFPQQRGALALAVSDEVWMMENSVYSVISPEGCASILWKDSSKAPQAAEALKMTAQDLFQLGVVERIIRQPKAEDGAMFESLKLLIGRTFEKNLMLSDEELTEQRYARFRKIGTSHINN